MLQDLGDRGIVQIKSLTQIGIADIPTEGLIEYLNSLMGREWKLTSRAARSRDPNVVEVSAWKLRAIEDSESSGCKWSPIPNPLWLRKSYRDETCCCTEGI